MVIQSNGSVGIGTTSPGSLLDVNGATTATGSNNYSSGAIRLTGNYYSGSSLADYWSATNVLGTGTTPTSTLKFTHSGSSGTATVSVPALTISGMSGGPYCLTETSGVVGNTGSACGAGGVHKLPGLQTKMLRVTLSLATPLLEVL